jgi:hypothetical protein
MVVDRLTLDGQRLTGFWVYLSPDVVAVRLKIGACGCG